jgi:predicted transcriptional regulator
MMVHSTTQDIVLTLDADTTVELTELAQARGHSVQQVLADAVRTYLEQEGRRLAMLEESIAAWNDFPTATQSTPAQADVWLSELEAGISDAGPPRSKS